MLNYIFLTVLYLSAAGAIASAGAAALCLIGKRLSPAVRYYVWLIPMLAFLAVVPQRAETELPEPQTKAVQTAAAAENTAAAADAGNVEAAAPAPKSAEADYSGYTPVKPQRDYTGVLAAVYALIAAVLLIKIPVSRILFARKMRRLSVANERLSEEYGVRVREFAGSGTPFTAGIFRPTVYIPEHRRDSEALMLRHELIHVKRRDLLYKLAADIVGAVHFFNPAVYVMKRFISRLCELSCDEAATKSLSAQQRREYAGMLLAFASAGTAPRFTAALTEGSGGMRSRIISVTRPRRRSFFTAAVSVVLVAALAFGTAAAAAEVNSRNTASAPRLSYVGKIYTQNSDGDSAVRYMVEFDRNQDFDVYFSNVLGRVTFRTAYKAVSRELYGSYMAYCDLADTAETKEQAEQMNGKADELLREMDKSENFIHNVEIELAKLKRSFGGVCFEGDFTIRVDGAEKTVEGRLINMPPCLDYLDEQPQLIFNIDGHELSLEFAFEGCDTSSVRRRLTEQRYYLDKNWLADGGGTTARVDYIAEIDGKSYVQDIMFNRELNMAWACIPVSRNVYIYLYAPTKIGENEIKGDMVLTDYRNDAPKSGITDIFEGTISNINGKVGEKLTVSGGGFEKSFEITAFTPPKTNARGTREVSEFDFGDEPVFIGTPFQQDEFDKTHRGGDVLYNRIVVDDYGKVMYIAPIEWQTAPTYYIAEGEQYSGSNSWLSLGGAAVMNIKSREKISVKWMLWDSVRGEIVAVIPPEYQFMAEGE